MSSNELVGRDEELAILRGAIELAATGRAQLLLIDGDAGIGKSALARALNCLLPAGCARLWARGEDIEQHLDFGIIEQLQRDAEAAGMRPASVLARGDDRPDPVIIGQRLLDAVDEVNPPPPLLVVVDDAQWADLASIQALTFAFRRACRRAVVLALITRPGAPALDPFERLIRDGHGRRISLTGLSPRDLAHLARQRTGAPVGARAAVRLHDHTGGNPLATVLLADELDPHAFSEGIDHLPAPRSFSSLVVGRLTSCTPAAAALVTATAVLGVPIEPTVAAAVAAVDPVDEPLIEAIDRGLLRYERRAGHQVVAIAHPLFRSAVLDDLNPGRVSELHRRAAAVVDDPDRALLHRLRAVIGQDAELGAEASARAADVLRRGWDLVAVELLLEAARVLPPGGQRIEARLRAADRLVAAGDAAAATELLAGVPSPPTALEQLVRGQLALLVGDHATAARALRAAWADATDDDVAARARGSGRRSPPWPGAGKRLASGPAAPSATPTAPVATPAMPTPCWPRRGRSTVTSPPGWTRSAAGPDGSATAPPAPTRCTPAAPCACGTAASTRPPTSSPRPSTAADPGPRC